jgi:hypothetical protein
MVHSKKGVSDSSIQFASLNFDITITAAPLSGDQSKLTFSRLEPRLLSMKVVKVMAGEKREYSTMSSCYEVLGGSRKAEAYHFTISY